MIEVCIGSACHLQGSYEVIEAMKRCLEEKGLANAVELKSSFCLGACGKGVSVRVDGDKIYSVNKDEVEAFIDKYIGGEQ